MEHPEPTLTAPEPAATPQPASSVETPTTKKPLAEMASWDEYRATIQPTEPEPAATAPVEAAEGEEAPAPQPEALEGFALDEAGRLHRPDGTFASSDEIEQWNATAPEPSTEEVIPSTEEGEQPAPEVHTVELRARDGATRTIEVDDPELAELLRTNANDGMRASEYRQRVAKVDAQLAELNAFRTMLETNPDAVIFDALPEDKRVALATKLVAQYWEQVYPHLLGFEQDPSQRVQAAMQTQMDMRQQQDQYQRTLAAQQAAAAIAQSVSALIPDTADDQLAEQFLADAEQDIRRAASQGHVSPEQVPQILAHRLKLYGFTSQQSASPAAPKAAVRFSAPAKADSPAVPTARPQGEKAAQLAEQARARAQRIQQSQTVRQRAAAVPPAGAGAAPVRVPVVPKGASIEDVSKELKKHRSWSSYTG